MSRWLRSGIALVLVGGCADDVPSRVGDTSGTANADESTSSGHADDDDVLSTAGSDVSGAGTSASDGGPTGGTTASDVSDGAVSTGEASSSGTGGACPRDEPATHTGPRTAIELTGVDCDAPATPGTAVLHSDAGLDWWFFEGVDPDGGCEPDSVRIAAFAEFPTNVCGFSDGCSVSCTQGVPDTDFGCCGLDLVEFSVDCGPGDGDDSTRITFIIGGGTASCESVGFEYEF